jgi:uncharacterized protein with PIN domain
MSTKLNCEIPQSLMDSIQKKQFDQEKYLTTCFRCKKRVYKGDCRKENKIVTAVPLKTFEVYICKNCI